MKTKVFRRIKQEEVKSLESRDISGNMNKLRPVRVTYEGKMLEGFFHRFVHTQYNFQSETRALIELADGKLRYFDPFFVQFTDREISNDKSRKPKKGISK